MVYTILYYKSRIHIINVPVLPRTAPIQNWPLLSLTLVARRATPPPCERRPRPNVITAKAPDDPPIVTNCHGRNWCALAENAAYTCVCIFMYVRVCEGVCMHDLHKRYKCPHPISYCVYWCLEKIKYIKTSGIILCKD